MVGPRIGVLALQGGYAEHAAMLTRLDTRWCYVRRVEELQHCDGLILPGGESTTQTRLARANGLDVALAEFAGQHPLFGSCAGLILLSHCDDAKVLSLRVLDVQIERNAYGRQRESFTAPLAVAFAMQESKPFPGVFIRAPKLGDCAAGVEVLARYQEQPVLVAQGAHFGMSFHPELTQDTRVHAAWLQRAFALPVSQSALVYGAA